MTLPNNQIKGWKYYNHAAIPTSAPHEVPDLTPVKDGSIWNIDGKKPLLVRYTTDWDCGYDTGWWYIIKDAPFDITALKTKRRYEITKALKFFDVREINPVDYAEELYKVQVAAFSAYTSKYRPEVDKHSFFKNVDNWSILQHLGKIRVLGAFYKETNELAGYCYVSICSTYIDFNVQKTNPAFEKYNANAALVYGLLESFAEDLKNGKYICDGSRSISHETHFQDYLEKYFGFRKAYCCLNIAYPKRVRTAVSLIYPFRESFRFVGKFLGKIQLVSSVLKMEEIARQSEKKIERSL